MDKEKPTFSNIGSGGAVIKGADLSLEKAKLDLVGMPAVLNYLDMLASKLEMIADNSQQVGIIAALEKQTVQIGLLAETIAEQDHTVTVNSAPIEVNVPALDPEIKVEPRVEIKVPEYRHLTPLIWAIFVLFAVMTFAMLDFTYGITDYIVGTGGGAFDHGLSK